jgi:AcrR family transcriptional regulator
MTSNVVHRGRPRDQDLGPAILAAALSLVQKMGYAAVTTEMIAAKAGVGKQSIYRRWPSKAELVLDAFLDHALEEVDKRETHAPPYIRESLTTFLTRTFAALKVSGLAMRSLMAAAQEDPIFCRSFRTRFIEPRRRSLQNLIGAAVERRELPPHTDSTAAAIVLYGALWYRLLLEEPLDARFAARLSDLVLNGLLRKND